MTHPDSAAVERFRSLIGRRFGFQYEDAKLGFLAEILQRRLDANDDAGDVYLGRLEIAPSQKELRALAQALTIPETYFFRNIEQFRALAEIALPERLRAQAIGKQLRFLSLGCASGEEPYSIAILARQALIDPSWNIFIRAVDLNPAILEKAMRGRYTNWALRETPPEIRRQWFSPNGGELILSDDIRDAVTFEEGNLADNDASFWRSTYDVIFCRNVLMYFSPECARAVVGRITRCLAPDGYLFLGHAENLRGLSQDYHLRHTHGTFYYQRKADSDQVNIQTPVACVSAAPLPTTAFDNTDAWVEAIGKAHERIHALTRQGPPTTEAPPSRHWDLASALDLLRQERIDEALDLVATLPPEAASDPDALLLRAVLLTHGGELASAESVCESLLALDGTNAGAHYVLALCREGGGDLEGAVDHNQVAAYLDPGFAMPRLHLGLLARKARDYAAARRELEQALVLLKREDPSRLLLFGGGFSREALIAMCEREVA